VRSPSFSQSQALTPTPHPAAGCPWLPTGRPCLLAGRSLRLPTTIPGAADRPELAFLPQAVGQNVFAFLFQVDAFKVLIVRFLFVFY